MDVHVDSICFHHHTKEVTIRLGPTKMDIQGRSCARTQRCNYNGFVLVSCPYCSAKTLYDTAIHRTNVDPFTDYARSVPLVGTVYDALVFPQNAAVVRAAQRDASLLVDEHGQPRVAAEELTVHFMRRSGPKALARQGTPLARIHWFGRWGGPTVLVHVDEVMQETSDYHDTNATWDDVKCESARLL